MTLYTVAFCPADAVANVAASIFGRSTYLVDTLPERLLERAKTFNDERSTWPAYEVTIEVKPIKA
jgi:hypothetical protein